MKEKEKTNEPVEEQSPGLWSRLKAAFTTPAADRPYLAGFKAELFEESQRITLWAGILSTVAWLGFAFDTDPKLHPDFTEFIYYRLGLSVTGILTVILYFIAPIRRRFNLLYIIGVYLFFVTPFFTARLAEDAAYMSGYMLVILLTILFPIPYRMILIIISGSLVIFGIGLAVYPPEISNAQTIYSFQNLAIAVIVTLVISFFLKKFKFQAYIDKQKLAETHEDLLNVHKTMSREVQVASEVQKGILPILPDSWHGFTFAAYWTPMEKVSGDFYDLFPLPGDSLAVLMADVSGHGIPAALVTTMAKIAFNEQGRLHKDLAEIYHHVNDQICQNVPGQEYLTSFMVRLEKDGHFQYSNASHNVALLARKEGKRLETLDTSGLFIGAVKEKTIPYEQKSEYLDFGDKLILYTDGIPEGRNAAGEEFGADRLHALILGNPDLNAAGLRDLIISEYQKFKNDTPLDDDVSLLVIERDPAWREYLEERSKVGRLLDKKDYEGALATAVKLLENPIEDPTRYLLLGKAYYYLGRWQDTLRELDRYQMYKPDYFHSYLLKASAALQLGETERAYREASQATKLRTRNAQGFYFAGVARLKQGNQAEARELLEKARKLDPSNTKISRALKKLG